MKSHEYIGSVAGIAKLILVVLAVVLIAVLPVSAKLENGAKIGLNRANLVGPDDEGFETKSGFIIGFFLAFEIAPNLALQPELLYTQKGSKGYMGNVTATFAMNYLEFPLLLRYTFSTSSDNSPFILFGPALALNTKGEFAISNALDETLWKNMANQKSIDIGLVLGGGVALKSGSTKVFLEARYTAGLPTLFNSVLPFDNANIMEKVEIPMAWEDGSPLDLKNGTLTIMIGVTL